MERNPHGKIERPKIGIGIYIMDTEGRILLGKRKGTHGAGEFAPPGGHLEFGETFEDAAKKEVREETGLEIGTIELFFVDNNLRYVKTDQKHYVTLSFRTKFLNGVPQVLEPDKCESWHWYSLNELPSPLAEFAERALDKLKSGPSSLFFD